jgi:hypothetical protein
MYIVLTIGGAALVGALLGLLGSGGSILTVPVLVYLLGHSDKSAIAESLAIVGALAVVGAIPYARHRQIDWRSAVLFGLPGMLGTYAGAWLALFVSGPVQLVLFAAVMLLAAWFMYRSAVTDPQTTSQVTNTSPHPTPHPRHPAWQIAIEGIVVGVLTGLVGVGGGFLIVPALVLLGGLPMRLAVGTSLVVIGLKSAAGFAKYWWAQQTLHLNFDWQVMGWFVVIGAIGIFWGEHFSRRANQRILKQGFAMFLVAMGIFVLWQELPHLFPSPTNSPPAGVITKLLN